MVCTIDDSDNLIVAIEDNDSYCVYETVVHQKIGGILETAELDSIIRHDAAASNRDRRRKFIREITNEMIAEMSGTFVIVQLGTGAVMSSIYRPPNGGGDRKSVV